MANAVGRTHKRNAVRLFIPVSVACLILFALFIFAGILGFPDLSGISSPQNDAVLKEVNDYSYGAAVSTGYKIRVKAGFPNMPSPSTRYRIPTDAIAVASIKDGKQTVKIDMDESGVSPAVIVVQKGIKTDLVINGIEIGDRNRSLVFPLYYTAGNLREGENLIKIVPETDFDFAAIDYSFYGYVKVVDNVGDFDIAALKDRLASFVPFIPGYYEDAADTASDAENGADGAGSSSSESSEGLEQEQEVPDVFEDTEAPSCH